MEIINARHPEFCTEEINKEHIYVMISNTHYLYFSGGACVKFDLHEGNYIYFIRDKERLWLYTTMEPLGFRLFIGGNRPTKQGVFTLKLVNRNLVQYLRSHFNMLPREHYKLRATESEFEGNRLIEIKLHYNEQETR